MKQEDEQRLQNLDVKNIKTIAGNYFARIFVAQNRDTEIEAVKGELAENTSMSSISNAVWANIQEMLENLSTKK